MSRVRLVGGRTKKDRNVTVLRSVSQVVEPEGQISNEVITVSGSGETIMRRAD